MKTGSGADDANDRAYSYRPSLLGAPWAFRLTAAGLAWEAGRKSGLVPYGDIRRVRLSFKPISMQTQRYMMEIWAERTVKLVIVSSSWKSMVEQERLDQSYADFVRDLHRRIASAGAPVVMEQGSASWRYWPGLAIFSAVALGIAFLVLRALLISEWAGAAFIGAFLALFLWYGVNYFRRNRPGFYRADQLPALLLPTSTPGPAPSV
jgi:hypothetical protein